MNPDFFVTTSENISTRTYPLPGQHADGMRQIPGIAEVQPVRIVRIDFRGTPVMLVAIDSLSIASGTRGRQVVAGDFDGMYRVAAGEKGLIVADNLAQLEN